MRIPSTSRSVRFVCIPWEDNKRDRFFALVIVSAARCVWSPPSSHEPFGRQKEQHKTQLVPMVRLMRVGICRSKYWTESRKDYDWHAVLQADKAVAAAIDAGVPEQEVKSRFVQHGIVDLVVANNATQAAMLCRPVLHGDALEQEKQRLGKLPLGSEAAVAGLSGEDVKRVKQMRMAKADACFRSMDAWEQTLHIVACDVCNRLLLADEAVLGCTAMGEKLVQQKGTGYKLCSLCTSAASNARARDRRNAQTHGPSANAQTGGPSAQGINGALLYPWGQLNDMQPAPVPEELQKLSMVERLCVALISPMMQIRFLRSGTRALHGNCIAFRQPVQKIATALPRYVSETGVLLVVRGLVSDEDKGNIQQGAKDWKLRREVVRAALLWLLRYCPPYMDAANQVSIDQARLASLPEDGSVFDALKSEQLKKAWREWVASQHTTSAPHCPECKQIQALCECHVRFIDEPATSDPSKEDFGFGV